MNKQVAIEALGEADILCIVGARPNFMKIAPIMAALAEAGDAVRALLVHTGQHYDAEMNDAFFRDLSIPKPDIDLGIGSASHTVQTANIMLGFEPILAATRPSAILVVGDVNSTIACALVAAKQHVPVIHVEAGLRSFDRAMPEEINRILTDQLSTLLFTTEKEAREQLCREGVSADGIHFVGNVMIDTLMRQLDRAIEPADTLAKYTHDNAFVHLDKGYALLTLHRPSNVDDSAVLEPLLQSIVAVSQRLPVIFPVHPRTRAILDNTGLAGILASADNVIQLPPLGYLEMLGMMRRSTLVLTDSGGLQEETTALGIPCITLRENTERPVTVEEGTNTIVGLDSAKMLAVVDEVLSSGGKAGKTPVLWDGQAAIRIRDILLSWLQTQPSYQARRQP